MNYNPVDQSNLFIDRQDALELFHNKLFCQPPKLRFLCITGAAGMGKTYLLKHFLHLAQEKYYAHCIPLDLRSRHSVFDILTAIAMHFDIPFSLKDREAIDTPNNSKLIAALTQNLLQSLPSNNIILLAFDNYEHSTSEVRDWIEKEFLAALYPLNHVLIILAGQIVPDISANWHTLGHTYQLTSITDANLWQAYTNQLGLDVSLSWLAGAITALNGIPADTVQLIHSIPRQIDSVLPLNEVKLVLVGEGSVGKTSLVNRLLYDAFKPQSKKTEGIAIYRWEIEVDTPVNSTSAFRDQKIKSRIQVNIWDFGGQEIMHTTHQFFLTEHTIYLLVLDNRLTEAENRLDYWLTLIRSFGGDSPILLIGNKSDQHSLDLNRRELLATHSTLCETIIETSCATGAGIPELCAIIAQQVAHMPYITDPFLTAWFEVKAKLENMDEDYISHQRYVEMCRTAGIEEVADQQVLLSILHNLGIVLHFPDPRLETTNILNPEWVTQGVYSILNTRLPFTEQGILTWDMLAQILDDEPYQEKRMFIVDMMQKFELCYELPDRPNTYLIPDLLPKEEPDTGAWKDALRFEVHYPVLPGSILTRLIVRMHRHIQGRVVWRTGVLLACDGNEALVKADLTANRITIAVRGPALGRRELLTRIREHLGGIHSSLAGLEAAEKVAVPGHPEIPPVDYKWLRELERKGFTEFPPPGLTEMVNVRHLLDGVEVRGGRGSGLSGGVLARLRETLLRCGPLDSDAALRTLFNDERLYPWRDRIPDSTRTREARADALIDALLEHRTSRGESALNLLLHILAEKTDSGDALHSTLIRLAEETG